jgi:hypothetical protein
MTLDKYISDLLYRYDCVIVPGFGGFITNRVSANNISSQHKFFPPTKEIAFNKHLDKNDGLLANYITNAKKISYTHAIEIIESSVAGWNNELEKDNTFDIKKVGSFKLNENRDLEFTAEEGVNYLTESYGLSAFTSISVKRDSDKVKVKTLNLDNTKLSTSNLSKVVKYAAILVPFIAISALSYYQMSTDTNIPINNANIGISPEKTIKEVSSPNKQIEKSTTKIITPKVIVAEKKVLKYHVISGAFGQKGNAEKNINILYNRGVKAELLGRNKNGLYIVSFKSFTNIKDATVFLSTIRIEENNKAWIWKKTF